MIARQNLFVAAGKGQHMCGKNWINLKRKIAIAMMLCMCVGIISACDQKGSSVDESTISEYDSTVGSTVLERDSTAESSTISECDSTVESTISECDSTAESEVPERDSERDHAVSLYNEAVEMFKDAEYDLSAWIQRAEELLEDIEKEKDWLTDTSSLESALEEAKAFLAGTSSVSEMHTDTEIIIEQAQSIHNEARQFNLVRTNLYDAFDDAEDKHLDYMGFRGIVALHAYFGDYHLYDGTNTFRSMDCRVELYGIDPESGACGILRTFSSDSCTIYLQQLGGSYIEANQNFNSDYTLMTAILTLENGEYHIGWIDQNGRFTDVSASITTKSDFGALTKHLAPRIGRDVIKDKEYIYFRDHTNKREQIKRVPLDNISPDAVEVVVDDAIGINRNYVIYSDGTVGNVYFYELDGGNPWSGKTLGNYGFNSSDIDDIDFFSGVCIATGNDRICKLQVDYYDKYVISCTPLIPDVKGRHNWNSVSKWKYKYEYDDGFPHPIPVRIAFLSQLEGIGQPIELFIVSSDGGEPNKINTPFSFVEGNLPWYYGGDNGAPLITGHYYTGLLSYGRMGNVIFEYDKESGS